MATAFRPPQEHRKVSVPLIIGIIFAPLIFAWFLLRQGYSENVRWIGFLWLGFCAVIGLIGQVSIPKPPSGAQDRVAQASLGTSPAAPKSGQVVARPDLEIAAEAEYLSLLASVEDDMKELGDIQREPDARGTWGSSLGSMGAIVEAYKEGAHLKLSPEGIARREAFAKKVADRQARAFPELRKIHSEDLAQRLWEHDVAVDVRGLARTTLRMTGFWFASNRNVKQIADTVHEDALALRYRRLEFRSHEGGRETYYDLEPLEDRELATGPFTSGPR